MSLRNRLIVGVTVVLVALIGSGAVVGALYRSSLTAQLDDRLAAYADRAPGLVGRLLVSDSGVGSGSTDTGSARPSFGAPPGGLSDVFVGVVADDGSIQPLITPTNESDLSPVLSSDALNLTAPVTAPNSGLSGDRVRVMVRSFDISGESPELVVIGISTREIESSFARLRRAALVAALLVTAVLAAVTVWMIRLGIRPIARMTAVADAVTAGHRSVRAPGFPRGTEAERLARALNEMIDETQRTERRLRRFVADASHELRTPLTTLRGYSSLFTAGGLPDTEAVSDAMRRIGSEANRMGIMVDDLLLLADLDEERPLERDPVDLRQVITDIVSDARVVEPERDISSSLPLLPTGELIVSGDVARLSQAIGALVANALRHTPLSAAVNVTGSRTTAGRVLVEVSDNGPGIAAEHLPHVFERFYRVDPARGRAGGGSGLGLSIIHAVVTAHGGTVSVASEVGRGTTFTLEL